MSSEKTLCPVCGSQVIHHYDNEGGYGGDGTHSYEPDTTESQRLREDMGIIAGPRTLSIEKAKRIAREALAGDAEQ